MSKGDLSKVVTVALSHRQGGLDLINWQEPDQLRTPLFRAASKGHPEVVKWLLQECGADPNIPHKRGGTPLFVASQKGHAEIVETLVRNTRVDVNRATSALATPLYAGSEGGHSAVVKVLLSHRNINPALESEDAVTPLYIACQNGHHEVVSHLLRHPLVDVNHPAAYVTPLHAASEFGHAEVVRVLLSHPQISANPYTPEEATPFLLACQHDRAEVVRILLQDPRVDVVLPMRGRLTPLWVASRHGHHQMVSILLGDARTDVNLTELRHGTSPLWVACEHGHLAVVREILRHPEVNVNCRNDCDVTPVWIAAEKGHLGVVKLLLGSRHTVANWRGTGNKSPEEIALEQGHTDIAFWIKMYDSNPELTRRVLQQEDSGNLPSLVFISELSLMFSASRLGADDAESLKVSETGSQKAVEEMRGRLDWFKENQTRLHDEIWRLRRGAQQSQSPEALILFSEREVSAATKDFDPAVAARRTKTSLIFASELSNVPVEIHVLHSGVHDDHGVTLARSLSQLETLTSSGYLRLPLGYVALSRKRLCLVYPPSGLHCVGDLLVTAGQFDWKARLQVTVSAANFADLLIKGAGLFTIDDPLFLSDTSSVFLRGPDDDVVFCSSALLRPTSKAASVTEHSLVFALGILMAQLLTGRRVVDRESRKKLLREVRSSMSSCAVLFPYSLLAHDLRGGCPQGVYRSFAQIMRGCLQDPLEEGSLTTPSLQKVKRQLSELAQGTHEVCVVCMDNPRNAVLSCGHGVTCSPCASLLLRHRSTCPVCRGHLEGFKEAPANSTY